MLSTATIHGPRLTRWVAAAGVLAGLAALPAPAHGAAQRIYLVAGSTQAAGLGDNGPATDAALDATGLALGADGSIAVTDGRTYQVRRIRPDGVIVPLAGVPAGGSSYGFSGDGGPAPLARFGVAPRGPALAADGSTLVADTNNARVRRIGPDGIISTVAGSGFGGPLGDGGPATQALVKPTGLAALPAGGFLIADCEGNRVRRVGADGRIETIAGTGAAAFSGDGGPAAAAALSCPAAVAVAPDGAVLVADAGNNRIRRIDPAGRIATVAGNGSSGFAGDGGPATGASLRAPSGVAVAPDGSFVIADRFNSRVRRVDPRGAITTLAGNGTSGEISSGGAAAAAGIGYVDSVQVAADGTVYLASGQIRAVSPGLPAPPDPQTITVRVLVPASPVLLAGARLAVKRSRVRSVRLPVAVSRAGSLDLRVLRGARTVARRQTRLRRGRNAVRLPVALRRLRAGRYVIRLTVTAADHSAGRARLALVLT